MKQTAALPTRENQFQAVFESTEERGYVVQFAATLESQTETEMLDEARQMARDVFRCRVEGHIVDDLPNRQSDVGIDDCIRAPVSFALQCEPPLPSATISACESSSQS